MNTTTDHHKNWTKHLAPASKTQGGKKEDDTPHLYLGKLPQSLIPVCKLHGALILSVLYWDTKVTLSQLHALVNDKDVCTKILEQLRAAGFIQESSLLLTPKAAAYFPQRTPIRQFTPDNTPIPPTTDPELKVQLDVIAWCKTKEPLPDDLRLRVDSITTPHIKVFCTNRIREKARNGV